MAPARGSFPDSCGTSMHRGVPCGLALAPTRAPPLHPTTPCHYMSVDTPLPGDSLGAGCPSCSDTGWGLALSLTCSGTGLGEGRMGTCGCQAGTTPKLSGRDPARRGATPMTRMRWLARASHGSGRDTYPPDRMPCQGAGNAPAMCPMSQGN